MVDSSHDIRRMLLCVARSVEGYHEGIYHSDDRGWRTVHHNYVTISENRTVPLYSYTGQHAFR